MTDAEWIAAVLASAEAGPTKSDLKDAPLLDHWSNVSYPGEDVMRLFGVVKNHPTIDDRTLTTSPLFAVNLAAGWARTRSRWYRLSPNFVPAIEADRDAELAALVAGLDVLRAGIRRSLREHQNTENKTSKPD